MNIARPPTPVIIPSEIATIQHQITEIEKEILKKQQERCLLEEMMYALCKQLSFIMPIPVILQSNSRARPREEITYHISIIGKDIHMLFQLLQQTKDYPGAEYELNMYNNSWRFGIHKIDESTKDQIIDIIQRLIAGEGNPPNDWLYRYTVGTIYRNEDDSTFC